ncbi:MAG: protease SohB [Gammaproteobacteria bacterium]|nr:protease SohB [Gammaproteobacteria bacterium]
MDYLVNYLVFLVETVTIVVAIAIILVIFFGLLARGRQRVEGQLIIEPLHEYYEDQKKALMEEVCCRKERKAEAKRRKREQKMNRKNQELRPKSSLYVLRFEGDIQASSVESLREEVSAVLQVAKPQDEILVLVESGGGLVHGYGLAAAQLERIRRRGIPLTVAVDKVAASGGYMMACVANRILAAPFAVLGSIGVVMQLPNFNRLLEKKGIDYEQVLAGEFKRTLTVFGKNTDDAREKVQEEINQIHELFKLFIAKYRPTVDLHQVATGEHWFGTDAKHLNLVDEIITSDDYILSAFETDSVNIFEVRYDIRRSLSQRMFSSVKNACLSLSNTLKTSANAS